MKADLDTILKQNTIMVIDGSMSTALEALGADLNSRLWTASVLKEDPGLVRRVHYDYLKAGADCGITCSYQASIKGLIEAGCSPEEAEELIVRSVGLFLEARDMWRKEESADSKRPYPLCLGSVGPYGAYLADGSEYTGRYSMDRDMLWEFHYRRMELLWEAGADMILIETQPSLREALIASEIAESLGADHWVSFSCVDERHTCGGDIISECARVLSQDHPHLKMIGVNCTDPELIVPLIRKIRENTHLPVAVYPNSGDIYDPKTKTWKASAGKKAFGEYALSYMTAGASAVGGCCTTVEKHIAEVCAAREAYLGMHKAKRIR